MAFRSAVVSGVISIVKSTSLSVGSKQINRSGDRRETFDVGLHRGYLRAARNRIVSGDGEGDSHPSQVLHNGINPSRRRRDLRVGEHPEDVVGGASALRRVLNPGE
ncbi:hypothetical protein U1Q18_052070 [Sarracenia purpurea var. burkii]